MRSKMRDSALGSVLAYRHYTETGSGNLEPEELKERYNPDML